MDPQYPDDERRNRLLQPRELDMFTLVKWFQLLNTPARAELTRLAWEGFRGRPFAAVERGLPGSPHFGIWKYRVRDAGRHGPWATQLFLITHEDDTHPSVMTGTEAKCASCHLQGAVFKIREESTFLRCGNCLGVLQARGRQP